MAGDWTDEQNDAIVADYFAMLADDIAGLVASDEARNMIVNRYSLLKTRKIEIGSHGELSPGANWRRPSDPNSYHWL